MLEVVPTPHGTADWHVYVAEAGMTDEVVLGVEHDRYKWVTLEEAVRRCQPELVSAPIWRTGGEHECRLE